MRVAVLGPGGVGGLLGALLARAGKEVVVVAKEQTAELISAEGIKVRSVMFGEFTAHPKAVSELTEPQDLLIVATKAVTLVEGLERIKAEVGLVVPLLNGLDHIALLRGRFGPRRVAAATIRVESDRPQPGVVVHTSPFIYVELASSDPEVLQRLEQVAALLGEVGVPARVKESEAEVMWSKLVRLNALACLTSAYDLPLGRIRNTPELYDELKAVIAEGAAVAQAEGAPIEAEEALQELELAHDSLGSSMQRDIAAGREPELDAIPGAVLRAAERHNLRCPTIERLVGQIAKRAAGRDREG